MDRQKWWSILKPVLKLGLTAALLYYVSTKIDLPTLKELFLKSDPVYIFLAFSFFILSVIISAWRSKGLLASIGLKLDYAFNLKLYLLGMFYNISLPGGVGGDGYKIYILRKKFQLPTKRLFLALLFDRLSGLWAIGMITVSLILFIPKIEIHPTLPVLLLLVGTAIYYWVMKRFFHDYSRAFVKTHLRAGALQLMQLLCIISILFSQHFTGKLSPYLFSFQLSTLASNLPFSAPGGIGVRETTMVAAAGYFGMDRDLAVFLSVSFYLISTLCSLSGIVFVYRSKEFEPAKEMKEEQEKAQN